MKKYEILYDWPIAEITRLTSSPEAEIYASQLTEPGQSNFVALTEKMLVLGAELARAKSECVHFTKWTDLRSFVDKFGQEYSSFPMPSVDKLKISLLLANQLFQLSPPLDTVDVDENMFELRELTQPVPLPWFCRENSNSLSDSVVVLSCVEHNAVVSEIASANISSSLLFHLMATLHKTDVLPTSQVILIKKETPQIDISAVSAFARLVVLSTGKPVHSAHEYVNAPFVLNPDEIKPGPTYQQWSEVLNVLSEYNSRKEVLLKYLTIYHAIENFMFKRPIVELERQMNGAMFSIRDFRRLYDGVEMKEHNALKKLFTSIFKMQASPTKTFEQHLTSRWSSLVPTVPEADINSALRTLGLGFTFNSLQGQAALANFTDLVYFIRNAIVHNKETEFHLTYASLNTIPAFCDLIEKFLLPSLEEICFELIGKPNAEFWYNRKEIKLY